MAVNQRSTASSHTQELPIKITRVALYARISTLNGQDPEMQLSELREYASRRGWPITNEYVDQGVSGSKESRPELNELMADAHRRKFDAVFGVEDRSLWTFAEASSQRTGGPLHLWRRVYKLSRQPRSEHSFRPANVPDHWRNG
jgi:hypothetical protein